VKADLFSSGAIAPITVRQIGDELIQTINARDIHRKPQVGRDFSNWIKDRIGMCAQYCRPARALEEQRSLVP
jgi:hypothetical protein